MLWAILVLLVIWIVGTAGFLLSPQIQRTAIRLVLRYYNIPFYIDYKSAKLSPGNFKFTDIFIEYSSKTDTLSASIDTLEIRYSFDKPILVSKLRLVKPQIDYQSASIDESNAKKNKFSLPDFVIKKLEIVDGNFKLDNFSVKNANIFGQLLAENDDIKITLDSISCAIPSRGNIHSAKGKVGFSENKLYVNLSVELDSTEVKLEMKNFNISQTTFDLISVSGDKINLTEIGKLIDIDFLEGFGSGNLKMSMKDTNTFEMDFSIEGILWSIPMVLNNAHLEFNDSLQIVKVFEKQGKVWGADVSDVILTFFIDKNPIEYHFQSAYAKDFDLNVFDIAHSSLSGSIDILGKSLDDDRQLSIRAKLSAGEFDNIKFDGGNFIANIDRMGVEFPSDMDTSFAFVDNDTVWFRGKVDDSGKIHLYCNIRASQPDTLLKALGYDYDISGYIGGSFKIIGDKNTTGIAVSLRGENISGYNISLDKVRIEGQMKDFDANIGNFIVVGTGGNVLSMAMDSLSLILRTGKGKYFFRPLIVNSPRGRLRTTGILFADDSISLRLDGLTLDETGNVSLISPVTVSLDNGIFSRNISFSAFDGIIKIDTLAYADSLLKIAGKMDGVNLKKLSLLIGQKFSLEGIVKGHFDWEMNPENFVGTGEFDLYSAPFSIEKFVFSSFSVKGKYHSDTLDIVHCYARRPDEAANLNGWVAFGDSVPSVHLEFSANGKKPGFVENFSSEITPIAGKYIINLFADGKINSPKLSGVASLDSGSFKISEIDDPFYNIKIRAKISGQKIELTEFNAESKTISPGNTGLFSRLLSSIFGQKFVSGKMSASGSIEFDNAGQPRINIGGKIDNFPLHSTEKGYYIVPNGTFDFISPPMHLNGNIEIVEGNILQLESSSPEPTKLPIPVDISVSTDNLWVLTKGMQGDMEAKIDGELFVTTADEKLSLLGQLDIDGGKYFVYGQTFTVENGRLDFKRINVVDPKLDITAKTTIGEEDIFLHITGTLSMPELELYSSNPDFTEEDILRIFAGISDSTVFRDALQQRTQDLLEQYLAHNIEQIAQKTLGVDEFIIEPASQNGSYFKPSDLRLTVGKRISGGLFLRYSQTLSDSAQQQFEVEYRFSRHFSLGAMQTQDGSYKLKMNLRWEY